MPRWRALPDELDPQMREFAGRLRRLVDRSGLSVSALADRTGYSKTSWDRYLNGRLLAPKGAIVALAEATGTDPAHLTTMWELVERAWGRSEMRLDMTTQAIGISQAHAPLGESGKAESGKAESGGASAYGAKGGGTAAQSPTATPQATGPDGAGPTEPPQPTGPQTQEPGSDVPASPNGSDTGNSWRLAGYKGPSQASGRTAASPRTPAESSDGSAGTPGAAGAYGSTPADGSPRDARPDAGDSSGTARRNHRLTMFLAGVVGALVVIAGVFYFTGGDGKKTEGASKPPASSASAHTDLPAGVRCSGARCTGKDPENMGCGGTLASTATSVTVGTTLLEVRYSKTCRAAWARITQAVQGDKVEVSAGASPRQTGSVKAARDTDAYTPMVEVKDAAEAKACVTLTSGRKGCTK